MMRKKLVGQSIEAYLGAVSRHSRPGGAVGYVAPYTCMHAEDIGWLACVSWARTTLGNKMR